MMAYVTRYIYGTDKLRTNAFEVRGLNASSTGVIHLDDLAILSSWLKYITDNIVGLTNLQVSLQLISVDILLQAIQFVAMTDETLQQKLPGW